MENNHPESQGSNDVWPLLVILLIGYTLSKISATHPDWELILKYIIALRWPAIVLLTFFLFKSKLPGLFDRITKLWWGPGGAEFGPSPQAPVLPSDTPEPDESELRTFRETSSSPAEARTFEALSLEDKLLYREIELDFERIYRIIYGTQLAGVERIAALPSGLREWGLTDLFQKHQAEAGKYAYQSVSDWAKILVNWQLLDYDEGTYTVTQKGEVFLNYLKDQHIVNTKAF